MKFQKSTQEFRSVLVIACFVFLSIASQAQGLKFANGFTNTAPQGGSASTRSLTVDAAGNSYITGIFSMMVDMDPGPGIFNLYSTTGNDVFFAKYDPAGNLVYAKSIGGTGADNASGIDVDGAGNVYLTGAFVNTVDFDPGAGVASLTSPGYDDIFIAKYDASGNYVWAKSVGANNSTDYSGGVVVDGSGNVTVAGTFMGTGDFDPGPGTVTLSSVASSYDIFMLKLDAAGNYVFAGRLGSANADNCQGIANDASGNIYLTGYYGNGADFDPGTGYTITTIAGGTIDAYIAKYDASGNFIWVKTMGGASNEYPAGIATDVSGNVYATGYFSASADFDPGPGTRTLTSVGNTDAFLVKLDATGNYVYANNFGSTGIDNGVSVTADAAGNAYVTGFYGGTADFDPGAGIVNLPVFGNSDIFIGKYDAAGNYVFAQGLGGPRPDNGINIALDGSGNIYAAGYFQGTVDFDAGAGTANLTAPGSGTNSYVLRLTNAGDYSLALLQGNYTTSNLDEMGRGITTDVAGNIYVTGTFNGTVDFDPGPGTAFLTSNGGLDIFVAKYTSTGDYVLAFAMGGIFSDYGYSIAVDAAQNIFLVGGFNGTVDMDPGAGTTNLTSVGSDDIFFAKFDASGNYMWAKGMGGTSQDFGQSIAVDGNGNVFLSGYFQGTVDFDPDAGTASITSAGSTDVFFAKYDASGNYIFAKTIGGTSAENNYSMALDASGNIHLTGNFLGTVDFDPGTGTANLSASNVDIFFAKYDNAGNYIFARRIGSTSNDMGRSIALDASGNIYITGYYTGTVDFNPSTATANLVSISGSVDVFFAKYDASGNYVFAKSVGGTGFDQVFGIAVAPSGSIYITGYYSGTVDVDPSAATVNLVSTAGSNDIYLIEYDNSGNYRWSKSVGGTGFDYGQALTVDASNNVTMTGYFQGSADFNPSSGSAAVLTSVNSYDVFVAQYAGTPSTLPVTLLNFTAKAGADGRSVLVNWQTAQEGNNRHFEIERSRDGQLFESIGTQAGCGSCSSVQSYSFVDNNPYSGQSSYRLKQVDLDGSFHYSPIASIVIRAGAEAVFYSYPAVTRSGVSVVVKGNATDRTVSLQLVSATGSLVKKQTVHLNRGDNRINVDLVSQAPGLYYIQLVDATGNTITTLKAVKE